jgi:YfiH family protein
VLSVLSVLPPEGRSVVTEVFTVFTTRRGGVSAPPYRERNLADHVGDDPAAVAANRADLAGEMGLAADRVVWLEQVHGVRVARVERAVPGAVPEADAAVTAVSGLALAVMTADCVPVLLADQDAHVIGVAHAGRAGAVAGIVPRTLDAMAQLGARPERLRVTIGAAICGRCYEVPSGLCDAVEEMLPGSACRTSAGTAGLDLRAGVVRQLAGHGVTDINCDPRCTAEDPDLYSFRRDGVTGRQAGLVWLTD